ncbi:MAG: filament integrity protein FraC, partial [Microcoleus sp.]
TTNRSSQIFMIANVFPFRTVLVQTLVLFLAIAIEARFLQKLLKLAPRNSVEYAAILNLSCCCVGWLVFFGIESVLSRNLREWLIDYVLLGGDREFYAVLTAIGIFILVVTFIAKWQALEVLEKLVLGTKKTPASEAQFRRSFTLTRRLPKKSFKVSTQFGAILIGHTVSNGVILVVLFLQSVN